MHVLDVKALEVVVDVERPVRVHEVVPCAQDVERELRERKLMEPSDKWREDRGDRHLRARCQRDEQEALSQPERDLCQIVRLRGEARGMLELRHRMKAAIQRETAAEMARRKRLYHHCTLALT